MPSDLFLIRAATKTPTYKNVIVAKTYAEKLKDPRWQKCRLDVLSRDGFTCQLCGDKETELHVHHLEYEFNKEPWGYPLTNFVAYCRHCHAAVEHLKKSYPDKVLKCQKRLLGGDTPIYMLLALMKSELKSCVAVISFDPDFNLEVHSILGPNTIRDMASLIQQNSETLKTPLHG